LRNKDGLRTFLNILGSLHRNRKKPVLFLFMVCFFFCLFFLKFLKPLQEQRQKGEGRAYENHFSSRSQTDTSGWVTFDLGRSFYASCFVCVGCSSPTPWCFMSFCCFFRFSRSSVLSHSKLQSKEFFYYACVIWAAEPEFCISQGPGVPLSAHFSDQTLLVFSLSLPVPQWNLSVPRVLA